MATRQPRCTAQLILVLPRRVHASATCVLRLFHISKKKPSFVRVRGRRGFREKALSMPGEGGSRSLSFAFVGVNGGYRALRMGLTIFLIFLFVTSIVQANTLKIDLKNDICKI